jgi:glycosyltransferase involved in cell wall biosynthesis
MRIVLTRREGIDSPDGVSIFIVSLAQELVERGHQVLIVVGSLQSRAKYQRLLSPRLDLFIHALSNRPLTGAASIPAWLRGKRLIDNFRPDLIIHSEAVPVPLRATVVQAVHDLQPRADRLASLWRSIRRFSFRRCDHVVATTAELRDELVKDLGMMPSELIIIPKCIDRRAYHGLDLPLRERAILHAGTAPYKDPVASIRAFALLNDPTVRLYITGETTPPVQAAASALPDRLRERVVFMGEADGGTVRNLHGRVRVAAFPTIYKVPVASATVMEAIASGTPIVGSRTLSRDLLVHGENGLVTDTDPVAFASACKAVLDDDVLWTRLSAGANRMVEKFDAGQVAERYLRLVPARAATPTFAGEAGFRPGSRLLEGHEFHPDRV